MLQYRDLSYSHDSPKDCTGHDDRAWHVAWNPARPLLASCSADKTVRLYNYTLSTNATPPLTFSLNTTIPTGHSKTVRGLAWSPSGKSLATASFDSNIGVWAQENEGGEDVPPSGEWECMSLLEGHETECKSVAYSSSGTLLASCSRDKTVWIWEGSFTSLSTAISTLITSQSILTLTSNAWPCSWSIHKMSSA